ncbi:helix-turn-helix domain-containing protein [Sphingomonas cavernae]|uniref:XRE family transcriptional regulator n=1 Tax=Sphingomonas cavernae TaxID=2320861 RepID=A0A418W6E0_9SPHN|nr:helix-turn-helix transcriptional regulator [Sphingomonas cavernae]RJF85606.1 XRE family transcriptional regulator [Sphingomonas cavernae]
MKQIDIGLELRKWRAHRRQSQMDLALDAEISPRHLSFVETGRSRPSRELVLKLAECLAVPPRERNTMLVSAGYAPIYPEKRFDSADMASARTAIAHVLAAYQPYPALAIDRHWNMVDANATLMTLMTGVASHLLVPPINALRVSLHPEGVAARIVNLPEWRSALFQRLREQIEASADPALVELLDELRGYPGGETAAAATAYPLAIPMILETPLGRLSMLSMSAVFGSPVDVTLSELAIESFLPADAETLAILQKL